MENPTPFPHSSNSSIQTLLVTPTNHVTTDEKKKKKKKKKNAMKNFQELIFKLAETHPNTPLNPAAKTLLQCRLKRFVSEYKTPDHPPYSSMIETALGELNEKTGSSLESISQHLEKSHDNLPFAHSVLLKHHLEKLVETGEIVVTRDKRYGLPGRLKLTTQVKRGGRRRKWRYDSERNSHNRRKQKRIKQRNSQKCEEVKAEYDEKEQHVTENGNTSDQTKLLPSCVSGKNGICGEEIGPPPGFESIDGEIESAVSSNRALRWQNRMNRRRLTALTLTPLKSSNEMETYEDQKKSFDSSRITMNHQDESQPKYRRLRVLLKPRPDTAEVKNVMLHFNSNQNLQPIKRRPGRPPKRAVVT